MSSNDPIIRVLKDYLIAEEGKTVFLECQLHEAIVVGETGITGEWQKNGKLIIPSHKWRIGSDRVWQMLQLSEITKEDEGIYCFILKTPDFNVYTQCLLYVIPHAYDNVTHCVPHSFDDNGGVSLHLRNCNVETGVRFHLRAEFSSYVWTCAWYKNNQLLTSGHPQSLLEHNRCSVSTLIFDKSNIADSGLYIVIAKTYDGKFLCSFANVLVGEDYVNILYNNETIPHIWQAPNGITEVYENDDVILLFKVTYDMHTIIEWTKDGRKVKFNYKIKCVTYYNRYIALKLDGVSCADSGEYNLIVRHELSQHSKIGSAILAVKEFPFLRPNPCNVIKKLKPAIVSSGHGVTFQASFEIPQRKYTYVVWIVGHYQIKKTDQRFKVMCNGGDFVLHIPVVTPEMDGEMTCQLRQHTPTQTSILLAKTRCYLTVLPSEVIEEEKRRNRLIHNNNIHYETTLRTVDPGLNREIIQDDNVTMHFQFSKINRGKFFFELLNQDEIFEYVSFNVYRKARFDVSGIFPKSDDFRISWFRSGNRNWYAIDVCDANGTYSEIGITHLSSMDIKEPPEDKLFKFRIRCQRPLTKKNSSILSHACEEVSLRNPRLMKILPYKDLRTTYATGLLAGYGMFAPVNLARCQGKLCAVKATQAKVRNTRMQAIKEYEILKNISHPNTVEIYDGYYRALEHGMVFTMEYLWGGVFNEETIDREHLTEIDVIVYVRQILLALHYLHSKKIAHLDIRPQNIMCPNPNSRIIKLIDFSKARVIDRAITMPANSQSHEFMPPEIINEHFVGTYSDMWSFGVMCYWLLTGSKPFDGLTNYHQTNFITNVLYYYDEIASRMVSDRAKSFVSQFLRGEPTDRMTAVAALNDIWITHGPEEGIPRKMYLHPNGDFVRTFAPVDSLLPWKKFSRQEATVHLGLNSDLSSVRAMFESMKLNARCRSNPYLDQVLIRRRCSIRLLKSRLRNKVLVGRIRM